MATLSPPEAHQEGQEALAALALPLLQKAWALFDPNLIEASVERFRMAVQAVVEFYGRAAAAAALDHFKTSRAAAGIPGRAPSVPAPSIPEGFVDQLVTEATALYSLDRPAGRDLLDSGAEQLILEQGRRQMMSAARLDSAARGWTRVPNEGACSFCLMLALRGPVYKRRKSADFKAHHKKPDGSGGDCRCSAEPVFGEWEPTARVREAQRIWEKATKGRSGHDARTAFRQAVEGREVTGAPGKSSVSRAGKGRKRENFKDAKSIDPIQFQREQLRILSALPPAKTPAAAEWRERRLAEIRDFLAANGE